MIGLPPSKVNAMRLVVFLVETPKSLKWIRKQGILLSKNHVRYQLIKLFLKD